METTRQKGASPKGLERLDVIGARLIRRLENEMTLSPGASVEGRAEIPPNVLRGPAIASPTPADGAALRHPPARKIDAAAQEVLLARIAVEIGKRRG